jgi:hypothetical protein
MVKLAWPFSSECVECRRYKSLSFVTDLMQNKLERLSLENIFLSGLIIVLKLGARKPTGENLKVVWAEFSTLSLAVMLCMPLRCIYNHGRA